jgi:nicotinamidase/pyrazinamidase
MAEALLIVDFQNDFTPGGALGVDGGDEIAGRLNELAADARFELVVATRDWHPPDHGSFRERGGIWPVHCVAGTWGAAFHPALDVRGPTVRKGSTGEDGYSGFTMRDPTTGETRPTELEGLLRERGVSRVVVCGLATDYCVRATALDAVRLGFTTILLRDAVRAVDLQSGDGERAIAEMAQAGVAVESAAVR